MDHPTITISKLDAARRQLQTAIALWADDGDPISIHTLACAAYEIIHIVSKRRNPQRRKLIFDSNAVTDEERSSFLRSLALCKNFFKHADKDPDDTIRFRSDLNEVFILFSIFGIWACGEKPDDQELSFVAWIQLHRFYSFSEDARKLMNDSFSIEAIEVFRSLGKKEFAKVAQAAIHLHALKERGQPGL
jgi:hypothetical protein